MENQENMNQSTPNDSKTGMWIGIIIVLIILVGGGYYFLTQEDTTNTNNANTTVNTSTAVNENTNSVSNANTPLNTNSATNTTTNTNSTVEGASKTYTGISGISFDYPSNWQIVDLEDSKAGIAIKPYDFVEFSLGGGLMASGSIYVKDIANPNNLSVEGLFDTFTDSSRFWFDTYSHVVVTIAATESVRFDAFQEEGTSYYRIEVYVPIEGTIINFSYLYTEDNYSETFQNILDSATATG